MSEPFEPPERLSPELRSRILERGRARLRRRRLLTTGGVALAVLAAAAPVALTLPGTGHDSQVKTGSVPVVRSTTSAPPPSSAPRRARSHSGSTASHLQQPATSLAGRVATTVPASVPGTDAPTTVTSPPTTQPCGSGQLQAKFLEWNGRGETGVWRFAVVNRAGSSCVLDGNFTVDIDLMGRGVTPIAGAQVPDPIDHLGPTTIVLARGDSAHLTLTMLESGKDCPPIVGFRLVPPSGSGVDAPAPGVHSFCGDLHISPPRAG